MKKKTEVRRYNFIVETTRVYSGLFEKVGFFGGYDLWKALSNKKIEISLKYNIPIKMIDVSNTWKD